jgi:hypothetical protein
MDAIDHRVGRANADPISDPPDSRVVAGAEKKPIVRKLGGETVDEPEFAKVGSAHYARL